MLMAPAASAPATTTPVSSATRPSPKSSSRVPTSARCRPRTSSSPSRAGRFDEADRRARSAPCSGAVPGGAPGSPRSASRRCRRTADPRAAGRARRRRRDDDDGARQAAAAPVLDATDRLAAEHPGAAGRPGRPGSVDLQVDEQLDADFQRAELFSLPVTLAILLIAFGAVVAAGVPLLLGVGAVMAAMGITAFVSRAGHAGGRRDAEPAAADRPGRRRRLRAVRAAPQPGGAGAGRLRRATRSSGAGATAGRAVVISGDHRRRRDVRDARRRRPVHARSRSARLPWSAVAVHRLGDRAAGAARRCSATRSRRCGCRSSAGGACAPDAERSLWGRLAGRVIRRPLVWSVAAGAVLLALAAPALGMKTALAGRRVAAAELAGGARRTAGSRPRSRRRGRRSTWWSRAPAAQQAAGRRRRCAAAFPAAQRPARSPATEPDLRDLDRRHRHGAAPRLPHDQSDAATDRAVDARPRADAPGRRTPRWPSVPGAPTAHVGGAAVSTDLQRWIDDRLPWVVGVRAGADVRRHAGVVRLALAGRRDRGPQPAVGRRGLRRDDAGLPEHLGGGPARLHVDRRHHGLAAAADVRHPLRALDGLPRVRGVPGPRGLEGRRLTARRRCASASRAAPAWSPARRRSWSRCSRSSGRCRQLELKQLGVGLATAILLDATLVRGVLLPAVLALLGERAHTRPAVGADPAPLTHRRPVPAARAPRSRGGGRRATAVEAPGRPRTGWHRSPLVRLTRAVRG